jgi:dCMP deaminase
VCHAELNAILNKNSASVKGCRMYVGDFPCNECCKLIIQAGLVEVVYNKDTSPKHPPYVAARRLLELAGVSYRQYTPTVPHVNIVFAKASQ